MVSSHRTIFRSIAEFLFLAVLAVVPAALVRFDLGDTGTWGGEYTATEFMQEFLLLLIAAIFWTLAVRKPEIRGFAVLVAGFFSAMLIREMDSFLNHIRHGFWVYPALLVSFASMGYVALRSRTSVVKPMADFFSTKAYFFIAIGLITLLFFSRTIGSGRLLWDSMLGAVEANDFKNALQEGIELYGYMMIAYGSALYSKLQMGRTSA